MMPRIEGIELPAADRPPGVNLATSGRDYCYLSRSSWERSRSPCDAGEGHAAN
jgi:hypothetical protein